MTAERSRVPAATLEASPRHSKLVLHLYVALLLASLARSAEAQPAPSRATTPEFATDVEVVNVDTVVTDKKGEPILGLTQDDFLVKEDGVLQEIVAFRAVEIADVPGREAPAERPRVSKNIEPRSAVGRVFVVVYDDLHLNPFQGERAKSAILEFLKKGTRPGDSVTLVATGGGAWWTATMPDGQGELVEILTRLEGRRIEEFNSMDWVTDYEAMRIHVFNDPEVYGQVHRRFATYGVATLEAQHLGEERRAENEDPIVYARASEVYFASVARNRQALAVLERALRALEAAGGRKSVILVSAGFINDPGLGAFRDVRMASRRANAPIYFLDARGLEGLPAFASAEFGPLIGSSDVGSAFLQSQEASDGSDGLAVDTGGFVVKNTNDLASGLRRIADASRNYYMLAYRSSNSARDGKFRKIEVKVERDGARVRARKGYYAPSDEPPAKRRVGDADPQLQAAVDAPWNLSGIPLRMTAYVMEERVFGKARTLVVAEADVADFAFEEQPGGPASDSGGQRAVDAAEYYMVVARRESGEFFEDARSIDMKLTPATLERVKTKWLPIVREFDLAPGHYQAKIVVRDGNAGTFGTLAHEFDVPKLDGLRLSTPILSDELIEPEAGRVRPRLVARREFANDGMLFSQFDVYGARSDPATGMPRVKAGYEVRRADGFVHTHQDPVPIVPTSLGSLSRTMGTRLGGAPPGRYELVLDVTDELSGQRLETREPFALVSESKPAAASLPQ